MPLSNALAAVSDVRSAYSATGRCVLKVSKSTNGSACSTLGKKSEAKAASKYLLLK